MVGIKQYLTFTIDYEKFRNEKNRNGRCDMENSFKFGTIVEEEYFTDRVKEVAFICQFLNSANHLILIFGKSCVVIKAVKQTGEFKTSTIYSALKKLQKDGYVIYTDRFELENPFYKLWIMNGM